MTLPHPKRSYLVLKWTCSSCSETNYAEGKMLDQDSEDTKASAEEHGCDPDELAVIADVLCCKRCETAHDMTNWGDDG